MRSFIGRARFGAFAAALVAVMALPGLASADTLLSESGEIDAHQLRDSQSKPGVFCNYSWNTYKLKSFTVRAPKVASDDAFGQEVGWQVQVQRRGANSDTWKTIHTSSVQRAMSSEGDWAPFTKRTITPAFPSDPNPLFTDYRIVVVLLAYHGDDSIAGKARRLVDYYETTFSSGETYGACSRETGIY